MAERAPYQSLSAEVQASLEVGAPVPALRACFDVLSCGETRSFERQTAEALLRDAFRHCGLTGLTQAAWHSAANMIAELPEESGRETWLTLLHRVKTVPRMPGDGYVNALVSTGRAIRERPIGLVVPLHVAAHPWAGAHQFFGKVDWALENAFAQGARVAHRYFIDHGVVGLGGASLLRHRSYSGQFHGLHSATGASVGLAAGLGVAASLLELPVPESFAFTGEVLADGRIEEVGGMEAKLAAATDEALDLVLCPRQAVPEGYCRVRSVGTFAESMDVVFGHQLAESVERVKARAAANPFPQLKWLLEEDDARAKVRVLISLIGDTDPFVRIPKTFQWMEPREEGNILSIRRYLPRLDVAYLLFTQDESKDDDKFPVFCHETRQELERGGCQVVSERLPGAAPADFTQFYVPLRDALYRIVDDLRQRFDPAETAVYVNETSGTPQMRLVLHLLVEQGVVPGRWLQVMRPEHAGGGSRVRRVVLPPALG